MNKIILNGGNEFLITDNVTKESMKDTNNVSVKGIRIVIADAGLEDIKTAFLNDFNTSIIKEYTESGTLLATFMNYTKCKMIGIDTTATYNGTNLIVVTLIEPVDMNALLKSTEIALAAITADNLRLNTELQTVTNQLNNIVDIDTLTLDEYKAYKIGLSKAALGKYLEENPITSEAHAGIPERYSVTADKQTYLAMMIQITTMANENNIAYTPSWNAVGKACTYDWTLAELQRLALEIESMVRPLISAQQYMENAINEATTVAAVSAINISFA